MSNCPDICTAEKCRELEERIEKLESDLELLKAAFEAHTEQEIPEAHLYEPEVDVSLAVNSTVFTEICEKNTTLAAPDWWQVRLGGSVPQIVCTFRRGATRTYHSLSIPHPINTTKPEEALIPEYEKGNWQGMIVLTDNSKFIVNCNSSSEAERVCNIARGLINPNFLPNPFKIWLTERKGEPVANDTMRPTSILYYSTGQRNLNPDWYMAIPKNSL